MTAPVDPSFGALPAGGEVTAVILAGGRGTRIAAQHPDTPKPMIPVAGRPFLHWVTAWAVAQGVRDIVYAVGHIPEPIEAWVATLACQTGLRLRCRWEAEPLGTAGAVRNCLDLAGEAVLVLNGDSLALVELARAFERLQAERLDGLVVGVEVADAGRYGSLDVGPDGRLRGFREKAPGRGLVNAGIYLLRRELLEGLAPETALSMEYDALPQALQRGAPIVVHAARDAPFLDIGTPESLARATEFIDANGDRLADLASPALFR